MKALFWFVTGVVGGLALGHVVANDPRGLIQRVEIDALLTPALRAALFPVETEVGR